MSLNTSIWNVANIDASKIVVPPAKRVRVTVDGEDLGTAAEVVVNSRAFGEGNPSVDLKDLVGLADVSFYGHVYRDLRKTNKELEAEVERLKQSRREQAENHKQKQANLQANFEQSAAGKARNTKLKRQLESSQSYNEHLKQCIREKDVEVADLQAKLKSVSPGSDGAEYFKHNYLEAKRQLDVAREDLDKARSGSAFWHEKFLESERRPEQTVEAWKTAYKAQKEHSAARREALDRVTKERDQLLADINCFMEDFTEGATAINRAVEDWNEKADD